MGRLTLITLVLFSVTAIYSEARAAADPGADAARMLDERGRVIIPAKTTRRAASSPSLSG